MALLSQSWSNAGKRGGADENTTRKREEVERERASEMRWIPEGLWGSIMPFGRGLRRDGVVQSGGAISLPEVM